MGLTALDADPSLYKHNWFIRQTISSGENVNKQAGSNPICTDVWSEQQIQARKRTYVWIGLVHDAHQIADQPSKEVIIYWNIVSKSYALISPDLSVITRYRVIHCWIYWLLSAQIYRFPA